MTVLIIQNQVLGPFKSIEVKADRLTCDNTDYPFTVIGDYTISEDDSLAPAPPQPHRDIKAEILAIESTITDRRRDEAILGIDNGWLADVRNQIAALRSLL